jgi:3-oxoacyl-[acyl-carrier protein] reductase
LLKKLKVTTKELDGKVVIVTGASKGIGAGIAKQMRFSGAKVIVNYLIAKEGADLVVSEIENAGGTALAVQGDMSKQDDVERLFLKRWLHLEWCMQWSIMLVSMSSHYSMM